MVTPMRLGWLAVGIGTALLCAVLIIAWPRSSPALTVDTSEGRYRVVSFVLSREGLAYVVRDDGLNPPFAVVPVKQGDRVVR